MSQIILISIRISNLDRNITSTISRLHNCFFFFLLSSRLHISSQHFAQQLKFVSSRHNIRPSNTIDYFRNILTQSKMTRQAKNEKTIVKTIHENSKVTKKLLYVHGDTLIWNFVLGIVKIDFGHTAFFPIFFFFIHKFQKNATVRSKLFPGVWICKFQICQSHYAMQLPYL